MAKIGYARVSTRDQNPEHQTDALTEAGCERIFVDKASGKLTSRPELDKAMQYLRSGDQLVITRLSRLGRSIRHLLEMAAQLGERNIDFQVLSQGIDTTTPHGRFTFHILAAVAELDRELIVEGTLDGLEAARARGRVGGRKPKLNPRQIEVAQKMYDSKEHTVEQIATTLRVSRQTVYRAIEHGHAKVKP